MENQDPPNASLNKRRLKQNLAPKGTDDVQNWGIIPQKRRMEDVCERLPYERRPYIGVALVKTISKPRDVAGHVRRREERKVVALPPPVRSSARGPNQNNKHGEENNEAGTENDREDRGDGGDDNGDDNGKADVEHLEAEDIYVAEDADMTTMCTHILRTLQKAVGDAQNAVNEQRNENISEEQIQELMDQYHISQTGGLALFRFVTNPHSFGQTIQNTFHVSVLVRDGKVRLYTDNRGMPYEEISTPRARTEAVREGGIAPKHQSVMALDMAQWEDLIELFDIKDPMIKLREAVKDEVNAEESDDEYQSASSTPCSEDP